MFDLSKNHFDLGELADPHFYNSTIDIKNKKKEKLISFLKKMILIRSVETKLAEKKRDGFIKGPVHLGVGQEAIPVGISSELLSKDRIFGAHRSHSHLLSLGSDVRKLFSEILAKATGHSKGMGGSMHLWDESVGFYGSVPIVAGTIPLAVGSALAARMQSTSDIAVAYFGDGATEEGVFHESLNLAKVLNCPIIFVCENNLFSSHMHISQRQPFSSESRFALANGIDFKVVDGNNVVEVAKVAKELIDKSRHKKVPTFMEAVTFRWYGHVDWREDIDVGVNRSKEEVDLWKMRDPVKRLFNSLMQLDLLKVEEFNEIKNNIQVLVDESWEIAIKDPSLGKNDLNKNVYSISGD